MRPKQWLLLMAVILASFILSAGCGQEKGGDGLSTKEVQIGTRTDQIIKLSGGNWENVSAEDKAYLVQEVGYGNERNARMFFDSMAGNLKGGGPPASPGASAASAPR